MAVTVVQSPQEIDLAYGPNFVTLNGLGTAQKFAIRVVNADTQDEVALVAQSENAVGRAQFDLQKIFQQYVNVSATDLETLGEIGYTIFRDSAVESTEFDIQCGTITNGVFTADVTLDKVIFNGIKPYNQIPYRGITDSAQAVIAGDDSNPPCTEVTRVGKMLTERPRNQFTSVGPLPPSVDAGTDYVAVELSSNDFYTISYFNDLKTSTPAPNVLAQGIEAFEICEIGSTNQIVDRTYIPNETGNDGGPNTTYQEGSAVLWPFIGLTMGAGPANLQGLNYVTTTGSIATFSFNPLTVEYWIIPRAYSPAQCSQQYLSQATHEPLLVRINNTPPCNEYPKIQCSWLNKWGFRDYFEFKLRQELSQKQKSKKYVKVWNDYNSSFAGYGSGSGAGILEGGETVFNKSVTTTLKANTAYLTDADSYYLNGLFRSSNVRMRTDADNIPYFTNWPNYQGSQWFPMVINNANYVEKTYRKNRLFQFEIEAAFAHNPQIQRGS